MARPLRIQFPGALYHIISRGIDGRDILYSDKEKQYLLKLFLQAKKFYKILIYLYCFLSNHYHISIETPLGNVSKILHWVNGTYTSWYNRIHKRKGHLFQGRYKSILVDKDEYLLELSRYIHLNPVKAGIVKRPEDYQWSSYNVYLGQKSSDLINKDFILNQFGSNPDSAKISYKKFVEEKIGVDDDLMKKVVKGFILGNEDFVKFVSSKVGDVKDDSEIPQLRVLRRKIEIDDFFRKINENGIYIKNKWVEDNMDRNIIIYLCRMLTLSSNKEIGKCFGLTDASVSCICKKIENCKNEESIKKRIDEISQNLNFET